MISKYFQPYGTFAFKVALINIFIFATGLMAVCNVKGRDLLLNSETSFSSTKVLASFSSSFWFSGTKTHHFSHRGLFEAM